MVATPAPAAPCDAAFFAAPPTEPPTEQTHASPTKAILDMFAVASLHGAPPQQQEQQQQEQQQEQQQMQEQEQEQEQEPAGGGWTAAAHAAAASSSTDDASAASSFHTQLLEDAHTISSASDNPAASSIQPLPAGWTEHVDDVGQTFYGHAATGVTRWERPLPSSGERARTPPPPPPPDTLGAPEPTEPELSLEVGHNEPAELRSPMRLSNSNSFADYSCSSPFDVDTSRPRVF